MIDQEFAKKLVQLNQESGNPIQRSFLAQAGFQAILDGKCLNPGHLRSCLDVARQLQDTTPGPEEPKAEEKLPNLDPSQPDKVYDELEKLAKGLRKEIFGSDKVPFPQWEAAVTWMQSEISQIVEKPRDREEGNALRLRFSELRKDLEVFFDRTVYLRMTTPSLEYPAEDGDHLVVGRVGAPKSHRALGRLTAFQYAASKQTGLQPVAVLIFVLSGLRTPFRFNIRTSEQIIGTKVAKTTLELPSAHPSWKDMVEVYDFLRWMRGNRKGLRNSTKVVIAEIKKAGGVPTEGIMEFWEKIAEAVNEKMGSDLTGAAARKRFGRLPHAIRRDLSQ